MHLAQEVEFLCPVAVIFILSDEQVHAYPVFPPIHQPFYFRRLKRSPAFRNRNEARPRNEPVLISGCHRYIGAFIVIHENRERVCRPIKTITANIDVCLRLFLPTKQFANLLKGILLIQNEVRIPVAIPVSCARPRNAELKRIQHAIFEVLIPQSRGECLRKTHSAINVRNKLLTRSRELARQHSPYGNGTVKPICRRSVQAGNARASRNQVTQRE